MSPSVIATGYLWIDVGCSINSSILCCDCIDVLISRRDVGSDRYGYLLLSWVSLERILIIQHEFFHVEIVGGRTSEWDETITVIRIRTVTSTLAPACIWWSAIGPDQNVLWGNHWTRFIHIQMLKRQTGPPHTCRFCNPRGRWWVR